MFRLIISIILLVCLILILFAYIDYLSLYNTNLKFSNINKKVKYDNKNSCILISGQVRQNYYESLLSQKINLIDPLNADVFCVFEDDIEIEDKNKIIELLNPKYIIWLNKNQHIKFNNNYSPNINYMFEKIYLCNNLKKKYEKENNFIYDFAVKTRPDLHIKSKIPSNIVNNTENTFYSPCNFKLDFATSILRLGVSDQIWMSNSKIMNIASDIFLDNINLKDKYENLCQVPEILLKKYLLKKNVKIKYFHNFYFILNSLDTNNASFLTSLLYVSKKPFNLHKCIKN